MSDQDVNTEGQEDHGFDESQIPDEVRSQIEKRARDGYIPKDRYDKSIGTLKDEISNLSAKFDAKQEPAPKADPVYTRAQLRSAVDAGQINDDQMDEIWANQVRKEAVAEARKETAAAATKSSASDKHTATLNEYYSHVGDLTDVSSDNRVAAEQAYADLVEIHGKPQTAEDKLRLDVAACRTAFGPLDKLKGRVDSLKKSGKNGSQEVGEGDDEGAPASKVKGIPKNLISYYEPLIQRGMYKDWDEVKAELKHASPTVKQRQGIK
jgi:hypothetical protein